MDKVKIVGLTSDKGRYLNGRIGTINALNENPNDGRANPYIAQQPDGRFKVTIEFDETKGREERPGQYSFVGEHKTFCLKRENLVMSSVGPGTIARDPEGRAILNKHGWDIMSTADRDVADPETAGFFPAIIQGDAVRAREILEVIKSRGEPNPANRMSDATGDAALLGGIHHGHVNIIKLLLEYGADPNQFCTVPMMKDHKVTYFNMAVLIFDLMASIKDQESAEEIVNALIDGGGNVHTMSPGKGTPLSSAVSIKSNHSARMRIARKILEKGADPNQITDGEACGAISDMRNEALVLPSACLDQHGEYSTVERLEMVQLLIDHGADPGKFVTLGVKGESCNSIHIAVSHKKNDELRVLLSCEKGRAAVNAKRTEKVQYAGENNGNGETAITMCVTGDDLERYKASRDMAVQLLKADADIEIEDHIGLSASIWLKDRHPEEPHVKRKELDGLVEKAKVIGPIFWESEEVKAFIEKGESDNIRCDNCGSLPGQAFCDGSTMNFQMCARCKKVHCK
jgi:ankyrin repeat protein